MDQIMESSHPTDVPQPPAPLWVAPRGKNRVAPTKKEYSDSMGIDVTAYSEIAKHPLKIYSTLIGGLSYPHMINRHTLMLFNNKSMHSSVQTLT
ncbi:hypothetical protein L211DRAFT_480801 [Terfezia boudieri ATCC MYA-4762]|uniref:Uncharacterized protein n=1 Tax=Terfezia boudieri ATCC MYA-4762 TaxID=1051890 RepID=A0A3N4LYT6_9PEZI|nr:hypothetical protein L211DRAFT_480801 [Terfezia boudieri ATCC MYA-4762]